MKLSSIGNDDMMTYMGLQKSNADFIVYGEIPDGYTYSEWSDMCRRFCNTEKSVGVLNRMGALNVIQSEGRILAYFIVEYIEVFDDFYGIGLKLHSCLSARNCIPLDDEDEISPLSARDYIKDKINIKKCLLKPYVTPPRKTKDGDILPDRIHYFILKLL